jgi:hypothetical protein
MADITMLPTAGDKPWDVPLNQAITNINVELENTIGVPPGGDADEVLIKSTGADYDMEWATLSGSGLVPDASTTTKGIVELATNGEATTGTDTVRAVTAAGVAAVLAAFAPGISKLEPITRTAYDLLSPPVATTLYVIDESL